MNLRRVDGECSGEKRRLRVGAGGAERALAGGCWEGRKGEPFGNVGVRWRKEAFTRIN